LPAGRPTKPEIKVAHKLNVSLLKKYSSEYLDPVKLLGPIVWPYVLHKHTTVRSGGRHHFDFRLGEPGRDIVHSFALPAGRFPTAGKKVLAIQGPIHAPESLIQEGEIPEGYGKGTLNIARKGIAEIIESGPASIKFNLYKGRDTDEFYLKKWKSADPRAWVLINVTPTPKSYPSGKLGKPTYRRLEDLKYDDENIIMQPKVSGAHTVIEARKGRQIKQFSTRESKRRKELIQHTWRNPALINYRPDFDAILRSELFAVRENGRAIPEQEVSGLLNSSVPNARRKLKDKGFVFKNLLFDVVEYAGKDYSKEPYDKRYEVLKELVDKIPNAEIPVSAKTREEKQRLYWAIKSKEFPITEEGVVLWSPAGVPGKVKAQEEEVVRVKDIFPGKGRLLGIGAGGFSYATRGASGKVGSGFTEAQRRDMMKNPENWLGKSVSIKSFGPSVHGSRKAPVFRSLHE